MCLYVQCEQNSAFTVIKVFKACEFFILNLLINKNTGESLQSRSLDFCMPWDKLKFNKRVDPICMTNSFLNFFLSYKYFRLFTDVLSAFRNYHFEIVVKTKNIIRQFAGEHSVIAGLHVHTSSSLREEMLWRRVAILDELQEQQS